MFQPLGSITSNPARVYKFDSLQPKKIVPELQILWIKSFEFSNPSIKFDFTGWLWMFCSGSCCLLFGLSLVQPERHARAFNRMPLSWNFYSISCRLKRAKRKPKTIELTVSVCTYPIYKYNSSFNILFLVCSPWNLVKFLQFSDRVTILFPTCHCGKI